MNCSDNARWRGFQDKEAVSHSTGRVASRMNLTFEDPVILESARNYGIDDTDMRHAYRNPIRVFGRRDLTMRDVLSGVAHKRERVKRAKV